MKFLKLPNGDYLNLNLVQKVKFTSEEDTQQIKHLVAQVDFMGDACYYRDNDAITIKDYLDKTHDNKTFLMHELDYATQSVGLGVAVQVIEALSGDDKREIAEELIKAASEKIKTMTPEQILAIRKSYEDNFGNHVAGLIGVIKL